MLCFETKLPREPYRCALEAIPDGTELSSLLFIDIETTGLSPSSAQIYLIGALCFPEAGPAVLRQWFAASLSEEQELLRSFFDFAAPFRTLVHFNGDRFDLPFLSACSAQYHLPYPLDRKDSLDFYANVAPFRSLFDSQKLTQRALEQRLQLTRKDPYSGAELIDRYRSWLTTRDEDLLQNLLGHNAADVSLLPQLFPLLRIPAFFRGPFVNTRISDRNEDFCITAESAVSLPFSLSRETETMELAAAETHIRLRLPRFSGTLYHYLKDYRNYYILKEDGSLLHKTLAAFVDADAREKATKESARLPLTGDFAAVPKRMKPEARCFQTGPNATPLYLPLSVLQENNALCEAYLTSTLTALKLRG